MPPARESRAMPANASRAIAATPIAPARSTPKDQLVAGPFLARQLVAGPFRHVSSLSTAGAIRVRRQGALFPRAKGLLRSPVPASPRVGFAPPAASHDPSP